VRYYSQRQTFFSVLDNVRMLADSAEVMQFDEVRAASGFPCCAVCALLCSVRPAVHWSPIVGVPIIGVFVDWPVS
jgi:hypothetical protein